MDYWIRNISHIISQKLSTLLIIDYIIMLLYFWVIWNKCLSLKFSSEKAAYQNWETDSMNNFSFNNFTVFVEK